MTTKDVFCNGWNAMCHCAGKLCRTWKICPMTDLPSPAKFVQPILWPPQGHMSVQPLKKTYLVAHMACHPSPPIFDSMGTDSRLCHLTLVPTETALHCTDTDLELPSSFGTTCHTATLLPAKVHMTSIPHQALYQLACIVDLCIVISKLRSFCSNFAELADCVYQSQFCKHSVRACEP